MKKKKFSKEFIKRLLINLINENNHKILLEFS